VLIHSWQDHDDDSEGLHTWDATNGWGKDDEEDELSKEM